MTLFSGVATATRSRRQQPGSAHAVEKAHDNLVGRAPARTLSRPQARLVGLRLDFYSVMNLALTSSGPVHSTKRTCLLAPVLTISSRSSSSPGAIGERLNIRLIVSPCGQLLPDFGRRLGRGRHR